MLVQVSKNKNCHKPFIPFMILWPRKKVVNYQAPKISNVISFYLIVTYRDLYQQDYCNIERGERLGMDLAGEYYFGRQMGRE